MGRAGHAARPFVPLGLSGYDGAQLAMFGDVVVVTVTHRLSSFGYLNLLDLGAPAEFKFASVAGLMDLVASLEATRATVARAKAELGEQSVEIARTERDFARAEALFKQKVMTDAEYDTAKYQHQSAVARRDSMQAAIDLAEARVREAEQLKENMFIRAPFDGTVISKDAEVGESILPGGRGR